MFTFKKKMRKKEQRGKCRQGHKVGRQFVLVVQFQNFFAKTFQIAFEFNSNGFQKIFARPSGILQLQDFFERTFEWLAIMRNTTSIVPLYIMEEHLTNRTILPLDLNSIPYSLCTLDEVANSMKTFPQPVLYMSRDDVVPKIIQNLTRYVASTEVTLIFFLSFFTPRDHRRRLRQISNNF